MKKRSPHLPFVLCRIEPPRTTDASVCGRHTPEQGIALAREKGVFVINLTIDHRRTQKIASRADVLVITNICDPDLLPLIRKRRDQEKVTVYEMTDDFGSSPAVCPEDDALLRRIVGSCDALQVTSPSLVERFGDLHPNCRLFRNQISRVPQERTHGRKSAFVVGWDEFHGSKEDIAEIAQLLSDWIIGERDAVLYLMASRPVWHLFEALPEEKRRFFPAGSIQGYYDYLRHIDVGIVPLRDIPSNRSRSDVQYLEYAVSGVVPVVRELASYTDTIVHGETGLLFRNPLELMDNLTLLSRNPALRGHMAKAARSFVLQNRLESAQAVEMVRFYRDLLQERSEAGNGHHFSGLINGWAAMDGAVVNGRHIYLGPTKFELLIREGLASAKIKSNRETCFRLFQRAAAIEPDNYLPYLYGASVSPCPVETLTKAVELNPFSLRARIMLGDALAERGDVSEALRTFKEAADLFADYEAPYSKAASLLERAGQSDEAERLSEQATLLFVQDPSRVLSDTASTARLHF